MSPVAFVLLPADSSGSEPGTGVGFCGSTLAAPTSSCCEAIVLVWLFPRVTVGEVVLLSCRSFVDPLCVTFSSDGRTVGNPRLGVGFTVVSTGCGVEDGVVNCRIVAFGFV